MAEIVGAAPAYATVFYVPSQYATIQKAVDAALRVGQANVVAIAPGIYRENVEIGKNVPSFSGGQVQLLVRGTGARPGDTVIEGSVLIHIGGAPPPTGNVILYLLAIRPSALNPTSAGVNSVAGNTLHVLNQCLVTGFKTGVLLQAGTHFQLFQSVVMSNTTGVGFMSGSGGAVEVLQSAITNNQGAGIVTSWGGESVTIRDSVIGWNGSYGVVANSAAKGFPYTKLIVADAQFVSNKTAHTSVGPYTVQVTNERPSACVDPSTAPRVTCSTAP